MITGFLGKGGSGKSTLSYRYVDFLLRQGNQVLAIDADHNMDLSYNLGVDINTNTPFIGRSMSDIRSLFNIPDTMHYAEIFLNEDITPRFKFNLDIQDIGVTDEYTKKWSILHRDKTLRTMIAGPHTEGILHGGGCSHTLFTPLKIYLPLLNLFDKNMVVVDEKAGTDSVGTGITTGFDFTFVCFENTEHSKKVAKQISNLLTFFESPHAFVLNKVSTPIDTSVLEQELGQKVFIFPFSTALISPESETPKTHDVHLQSMFEYAKKHNTTNNRKLTTIKKFKRNIDH